MTIHLADLYPRIDTADAAAANEPAYAYTEHKTCILGNGFVEVRIHYDGKERNRALLLNKLTGERFTLEFCPFVALFEHVEISGSEGRLVRIDARGSSDVSSTTALLSFEWFDMEVTHVITRGAHFLQKRLVVRNVKIPSFLHRVSLFTHRILPKYQAVLHDGGLFSPTIFYRSERGSLFFCVDYPCYFARMDAQRFTFDYYPGASLSPGRSFQTLTAILGVCERAGRSYHTPYHDTGAELDAGEVQWFREYLRRGAPSAQLPAVEMRAPAWGAPGPSDLETLDQAARLGAQSVTLPRVLAAVESYPDLDVVREAVDASGVGCRYLWSRDEAEDLRWLSPHPDDISDDGQPTAFYSINAFRDHLIEHNLGLIERFGFNEVEVSGPPIVPYYSSRIRQLDETTRREQLHQAFQGLIEVVAALNENVSHVGSGGAYGCYGIGLARIFAYTGGLAEDHPLPLPDLHPARLFADQARLYYRRSRAFLMPKALLANSVGLAPEAHPDAPYPGASVYPWYLYHDRVGWRYALISAIATGLRHRFHALPVSLPEEDLQFARKWLKWEADRLNDLLEGEEILDDPGLGAVDGYSYMGQRGAIVFLFNNSYDAQDVALQLHLAKDTDYLIRELYPREMNYLGPIEGLFRRDSVVQLRLESREACVFEAVRRSPAAVKRKRPEIFGAESEDRQGRVVLRGHPGERVSVGVRVGGKFRVQDVRFPGNAITRHMTEWVYAQRRFDEGKPTLPQGAFPGAPLRANQGALRDAWLCARVQLPVETADRIDCSPFRLTRPCWSYDDRLLFVVRFEPPPAFDPIRTSSEIADIPECFGERQAMKCGIDLAPLNIGLKAWVNGHPCAVHPVIAAWKRLSPNPAPIVAYCFEAGSKLQFGSRNHVVLYARRLDAAIFRGVTIEHLPDLRVEKELEPR